MHLCVFAPTCVDVHAVSRPEAVCPYMGIISRGWHLQTSAFYLIITSVQTSQTFHEALHVIHVYILSVCVCGWVWCACGGVSWCVCVCGGVGGWWGCWWVRVLMWLPVYVHKCVLGLSSIEAAES